VGNNNRRVVTFEVNGNQTYGTVREGPLLGTHGRGEGFWRITWMRCQGCVWWHLKDRKEDIGIVRVKQKRRRCRWIEKRCQLKMKDREANQKSAVSGV
jgi:hypothetical protein